MDRFIEQVQKFFWLKLFYLKSNMDRFIELSQIPKSLWECYLKSNMDRFIAERQRQIIELHTKFKIQYG